MSPINNYKIELLINDIENKLSKISSYPIIGTFAGVTKIFLGLVQMIALPIIFAVQDLLQINSDAFQQSFTHLKHGAANILAGILESIPCVQSVLFKKRQARMTASDHRRIFIRTHHESKFMPYEDLVERDCEFAGTNKTAIQISKKFYEELKTNYPSIYDRRRASILYCLATM